MRTKMIDVNKTKAPYVRGFTLIELMIAVAIVGIVAAIAYPSYINYMKKTHRTEAKGQLVNVAQSLERYRSKNFNYEGADSKLRSLVPDLRKDGDSFGTKHYDITMKYGKDGDEEKKSEFILIAKPVSNLMSGDGDFRLDNRGNSCYKCDNNPDSGDSWNN